eukprot:3658975-Alexandrium_andersonii.AAC.1
MSASPELAEQCHVQCETMRVGIVPAGCALYIPPGSIMCEKTSGNAWTYGIRLSVIIDNGPGFESYQTITGFVAAAH